MRDQGATEDELLTLRTPLGLPAARKVVHDYFQAVLNESYHTMSELLSSTANVHNIRPSRGARYHRGYERRLLSWWRSRFRRHDYGKLVDRVVYRDADIETYRSDQLDALPYDVVHGTSATVGDNDIVLRVPIVTQTILGERLFGEEVYFWLRRQNDRYVIYHVAEPFQF